MANWWEARLPRQDQPTLTQKKFVYLAQQGRLGIACVFMVLLLASINEQVNLGYALSFIAGAPLWLRCTKPMRICTACRCAYCPCAMCMRAMCSACR